jgi:hypothetical protein
MDDAATWVIQQAERVVRAAGWRIQEDDVLRRLAGTHGLARARFEPRTDAIQLVTYDGEHLGHVRHEGSHQPGRPWVAVLKGRRRPIGAYASAQAAAAELAKACGKVTDQQE